jgi:hypothetical protein
MHAFAERRRRARRARRHGRDRRRRQRFHLPATLATATVQALRGDGTAVLKLSEKAAGKLHARRATRASAAIVATDAAGNRATRTMKVTLT